MIPAVITPADVAALDDLARILATQPQANPACLTKFVGPLKRVACALDALRTDIDRVA